MQINCLLTHTFYDTVVVNYEKFCLEPVETINGLFSNFGLAPEEAVFDFRNKPHHNIAGNPMRFSTERSSTISCDNEWINGLSSLDKSLCKLANTALTTKLKHIKENFRSY
jgi:hypothetical protein